MRAIVTTLAILAVVVVGLMAQVGAGLKVGAVQMVSEDAPSGSAHDTAMLNAASILAITITHNAHDLLVFPEFELLGSYNAGDCVTKGKTSLAPYCEPIPVAGSAVNCSLTNSSMLSLIACGTAEVTNTTVSYNACEYDETSGDYYNTQVVVKQGTVLAKYRKYHPFFTACYSKPALEIVTFDVSGATFGLFTCYDIMFKHPKDTLVKDGVKLFSYSSFIPTIGLELVELFSLKNKVIVVNANLAAGESAVVVDGVAVATCAGKTGTCVATAST